MHLIKIQPILKQNLAPFSPPTSTQKPNTSLVFARNVAIVLGGVLFICVLLHFVVRYYMKKKRSLNSDNESLRFQETSDQNEDVVVAYERQLQQLFNLHDSGLDQAFIDALPVFMYKELIMGLKEPFDCAVCLCEFAQSDKLRLLPLCSHAFHIHCIDTWLLSNSSCPLCRDTLFTHGENPVFDFHFDDQMEDEFEGNEKRVLPVRLGKFRATNGEKKEVGETSNSNIDARRCFSMGSYEYVVGNYELQVTFCPNKGKKDLEVEKDKGRNSIDGGSDGKKISSRSKGESFSVSKIWLWSKKDQQKFQDSSNSSFNVSLPWGAHT
ncbi:zinc finger, RING/FYVE/PHD-type [Artemisia annua]|uniref:RING-type E3 ubiquitin transferase n=1 Tax=Artemisia annua TaxID=35608 RepID=A0A2U1NP94_ARTAN|nr:zinc finger, RING/FYVE/PHD-type [Artemisia annua]